MSDEKDDAVDDVIEDQPDTESKEEPEKVELTLEQVAQIAKATQKGYTIQQQQLSSIRENLDAIATSINEKSGAKQGEDEYVTVNSLRQILAEQQQAGQMVQEQANDYIETTLGQLTAEGILEGKADEDSLLQFALKVKEPDLQRASVAWQEIKAARKEGAIAKKQVRQEEGSKIGTSSKTGTEKEQGVNYRDIRKMDWFNF
jgi:hypothetical protein